jgi:isoleucyl-tRNA synthetase
MPYNFTKKEHNIQDFWKKENIFEKSLEKNKNNKPFVFYDGPPFATGSPHYGHILAGAIKDTICRNAQFNDYYVERRAGFDCHGLPVDHIVDKKLGLKNYQQIIDYGIKKYNDECRGVVLRCVDEWISTLERFGRWMDFENGYKTMDTNYMESDWSVFNILWKKGLIYKGLKVMSYSTALGTPLSNFEAKSNYRSVTEESIIVKFKDTITSWNYLVWTTTPWTLPSNMALCVNKDMEYNVVKYLNEYYVVAKSLLKSVFGSGKKQKLPDGMTITMTMKGSQLVGSEYKPIMNYYESDTDYKYKIISDDFVTDDSGTGIVHISPAFGEADLKVCIENNIVSKAGNGIRCPVDKNGCFTDLIYEFTGKNVKECDKSIIVLLKEANKLFKRFNNQHEIAFCWRSDTPLIYKAVDSWFIDINAIKPQLLANNLKTNWIPEHIRDKRFHNWLEDARDWGFSRTRVWGTPIPIYTDGDEYYCVSSIAELEQLAGLEPGTVTDLHRDNIDHLIITSPKTGNKLQRIDDVFDCWFESGAMPFAHQHFPFEKKFNFPADFIAEGVDQTRGWFYTLLVLSTIVKNEPAFKNVIVNGLVLANNGKKMSKRLKNYPNPIEVIDRYGADSLRLYLLCSPIVKAETLSFSEDGVRDISKSVLIPFENSYSFYYEQKMKYESKYNEQLSITELQSNNVYDKWIIHKMNSFKNELFNDLNSYRLFNCKTYIMSFVEKLNNQYIKLNKFRLKGDINQQSCKSFINTLGLCMLNLTIILSSLTPFFSEYLYQKLKNDLSEGLINTKVSLNNSIHLLSYKNLQLEEFNEETKKQFDHIDKLHEIINLVRIIRARDNIPFKMPVSDIIVCSNNAKLKEQINFVLDHLKTESNILNVQFDDINKYSQQIITCNKSTIGRQFKKMAKPIYAQVAKLSNEYVLKNIDNLEINDVTLNKSHFNVQRNIMNKENYSYESTNDLIIYLNQTKNREIILQYYSKLLSTTIQKFRKELELKPWDKIIVNYVTQSNDFQEAFLTHKQTINDNINNPVHMNSNSNKANVIGEKDVTLENNKLKLQIMKSDD